MDLDPPKLFEIKNCKKLRYVTRLKNSYAFALRKLRSLKKNTSMDLDPPKRFEIKNCKKLRYVTRLKKLSFVSRKLETSESVGGAGGIRTLVQTSNENAFYMHSFRLIFDAGLTGNGLTNAYLLWFWCYHRSASSLISTFTVLRIESPSTEAIQEHLASLPSRDEANLTIIQIKRQERIYFRLLKVWKMRFTSCSPALGMLTSPLVSLSKTSRPLQ